MSLSNLNEGDRMTEKSQMDNKLNAGAFFDFKPEFGLWLATSNRPIIQGQDKAVWRIMPMVIFRAVLAANSRTGPSSPPLPRLPQSPARVDRPAQD